MASDRSHPSPDRADGGCGGPSTRELEDLLREIGPGNGAEAIAQHLESCAACRDRLDRLSGSSSIPPAGDAFLKAPVSPVLAALMQELASHPPAVAGEHRASRPSDDPILAPPVAPDAIGRFAGYDVLERVAEGGMGIVFKARDPALGRVVALKVLAPALATSAQARDRFLREARAAAAVSHEHVVAIHAVGQERDLPYLVMQFIQGTTLEARLRQGPLDLLPLLRIAHQTALGLAAAHDQGLIHRDIKPGNLLLENGVERVKITDFGLARAADQPGLTRAGRIAGTPEFMSPEQAGGLALDARSDLFSLGAVLYAMGTGQSPFHADSIAATLHRVAEHHPPAADTLNPALPEELTELIQRLLAKGPEFRPVSAHSVAATLADLMSRHASDARLGPPVATHGRTPSRPSRALLLFVASVILAAYVVPRFAGSRGPVRAPAVDPASAEAESTPPTAARDYRVFDPATGSWKPAQSSLPLAVAAAPAGGIIEIAHSGVVECDPIAITGKPLTLRAAPGHTPTLVNRSTDLPLLRSDSPLTLRGLELRAAFGDSDRSPPWPERLTTRRLVSARLRERSSLLSLVQVRDAALDLTDCRLVASSRRDASSDLLSIFGSTRLTLRRTELYNTAGAGILWRRRETGDAPELELVECLVYCNQPILLAGAAADRFPIRIERSTIFGEHVVALPLPMEASLSLHDSVVCSRGFLNPVTESKAAMRWSLSESNNLLLPIVSDAPFPPAGTQPGPGSLRLDISYRDLLAARTRIAEPLSALDFALPVEVLMAIPRVDVDELLRRGTPAARASSRPTPSPPAGNRSHRAP